MNADEALIRAFNLGMGDEGWTDEDMEEAELLLPTLVAAGYAASDAHTWRFTEKGVARFDEIATEEPR